MYIKKLLGLVFISSLCLASATAVAVSRDLVAIYKSGMQQYFIDQAKGFVETAKAKGYKARIINVELDANKAISAVDDAIASGVMGIAITAPDQGIGPAVATSAEKAGIPLVATDDPLRTKSGTPVPFVGFDGTAMGTSVGKAAAGLLKKSGWMKDDDYGILTTEYQTVSVCNDRTNASRAQLEKIGVPKSKFHTVVYDGTTNNALTAAGAVITANPKINEWVVYACNDEGALGTVNALKNAGFATKNVIAVGLGAYEACRPWAAKVPSGFKAALYLSGEDVGKAAANALIKAISSRKPLPLKTVAKTTIVTPKTWAKIMPCN